MRLRDNLTSEMAGCSLERHSRAALMQQAIEAVGSGTVLGSITEYLAEQSSATLADHPQEDSRLNQVSIRCPPADGGVAALSHAVLPYYDQLSSHVLCLSLWCFLTRCFAALVQCVVAL